MWNPPQYDIIVETLTGSQFEVTVTDKDTVGYIKSRIQKFEGIPVEQQHIIYKHKELLDKTEIKDIPLVKGSTVKLVLDMKGGPVSARRVVTLPGYDKWFDLSDVLGHSGQDSLPVKLLVYKDFKKNIHRVMKFRADRKNIASSRNGGPSVVDVPSEFPHDDEAQDNQWLKDNIQTLEKMLQLKLKLEKKKLSNSKLSKFNQVFKKDEDSLLPESTSLEDDTSDLLKDEEKLENLAAMLNDNSTDLPLHHRFMRHSEKIDKKNLDTEFDMFLDGLILDDTRIKETHNSQSSKSFSLSPRRPLKNQEKSNFSRFFHHRNSSPTLNTSPLPIATPQPIASSTSSLASTASASVNDFSISQSDSNSATNNYLDNKQQKTNNFNSNFIYEYRNKYRENIRLNRTLKFIENDFIIEENEPPPNLRLLSAAASTATITDAASNKKSKISKLRSNTTSSSTSTSVQDLMMEHIHHSPSTSPSNKLKVLKSNMLSRCNSSNSNSNTSSSQHQQVNSAKLSKRWNPPPNILPPSSGYENKLFIDKEQTYSTMLGGLAGAASDIRKCSAAEEYKADSENLENSFRVFKMTSDAKSSYELPKLLIREDSPVESMHSSDSQLETIALRGNSAKNAINSFNKLEAVETTSTETNLDSNMEMNEDFNSTTSKNSLLKLYDSGAAEQNQHATRDQLLNMYDTSDGGGGCCGGASGNIENRLNNNTTWSYHYNSELGLNKIEFKFLKDDAPVGMGAATSSSGAEGGGVGCGLGNCDDISSDDDNDDVFNSCELLNNKSKSVELNEFRMMFGSSPTLLNTNSYNFNPITQTSRLDAVPFQYRRGYSNLNDACLSSSTSDLECFQNSNKKKVFNKNSSDLPSLYRHRNNEHLDYIRSYENLDRTRIVRMRNDRITSSSASASAKTTSSNGSSLHMSRDRCLQEEDDDDAFSSYSNLCFDNDKATVGCIGAGGGVNGSKSKKDADHGCGSSGGGGIGGAFNYPSDESFFNFHFDKFDDDVLEIDTMRLFENSIDIETSNSSSTTSLTAAATATGSGTSGSSKSNTSTLLLPDINNKLLNINSEGCNLIKIGGTSNGLLPAVKSSSQQQDGGASLENSKPKKLRCAQCNKKLGVIMIMKCHCEQLFCAQHRYAEAHNCTYNFKEAGKLIIAKENPLVIAQKLPKL